MRITDGMRQNDALRSLQRLSSRHAEATARALSGRKVDLPSSDPAAAAELVRVQAARVQNATGREAATHARGDLELAEGVLAEAGDLFQRAHEIAMQGANGSLDAQNRTDLAKEVAQLKSQLVTIANTKGSVGYLFAGSKVTTTPFSSAGAFAGDDLDHVVDLGSGNPTSVGVSGERAFTVAGGRDVFADLTALQTALESNDQAGVGATLSNLEASRKQLMAVQADAGLKLERLEMTESVMARVDLALAQRDEAIGAADPYESYSAMVSLQQSLEQAAAVAKRVLELGNLFRY